MQFGEPLWLISLALVLPGFLLLYFWSNRRKSAQLTRFASSKLIASLTDNHSPVRQRLKAGMILLALLLLGCSLARPQLGVELEENEARGIDIMIALDTSRSMLAEDVKPNRLERSKLAILDLLNAVKGDRVGLIAFAGEAFLQCPLTLDYDAFRATLNATDTSVIARGGTDVAAAIEEAASALKGDRNFKLLVLITDGEDLEASGLAAARAAGEEGLRIFTVGVGSSAGELIPIRNPQGDLDYLRDQSGTLVRSALDEESLRSIAALSNGFYSTLAGSEGLNTIYAQLVAELPAEEFGTRIQEIPLERYPWPTLIALVLLFLEPIVSNRRRRNRRSPADVLGKALLLALCFLAIGKTPLTASPAAGLSAYEAGDYARAETIFREEIEKAPKDSRLHYNLGNALYRQGRWIEAEAAFRAALQTRDTGEQVDAFFNLGNTLYQLGLATTDDVDGRTDRLLRWEQALEAYANAEALQPGTSDLETNKRLVLRARNSISGRIETLVEPGGAGMAGPSGRYALGTRLEMAATANAGWAFDQWADVPTEDPTAKEFTFTVDRNYTPIAKFVKTWDLEVLSHDLDRGSARESGSYREDRPVTITAEATEPWVFHHWEAEGVEIEQPDAAQTPITLTQDAKVTAYFAEGYYLEVIPNEPLGGYVGQTGWYLQESETPVKAEVREGFEWLFWSGEGMADTSAKETTVSMTSNRQVVANFDRLWSLIVAEDNREAGTVTGSGDFPIGTTTPITATANPGYKFVQWLGEGIEDPTSAETTVTVNGLLHDVVATFEAEESEDQNQDNEDEKENSDQNEDQQNQEEEEQEPSESEEEPEEQQEPEEEQPSEEEPQPPEEEESEAPEEQRAESQPREMGEMTEEEARQLLNALRESEKKLPAVRRGDDNGKRTGRDW